MIDTERLRIAGVACAIGGVLWVSNVLLGVVNYGAMHGDITTFRSWEAVFGRTAFVLAELHNFAKGTDDSPLLPLGALTTGIGMVLVGIAVVRARRWGGWHRPLPLLVGLYPFVAMFPILAATGQPPEPMIALWGILWLLLGLALRAEAGAAVPVSLQPLAAQ